jgi:hypothetical protein
MPTRPDRGRLTLFVTALAALGGLASVALFPTWAESHDPAATPFLGERRVNAFITDGVINHTEGQRFAHRWGLLVFALAAAAFLLAGRPANPADLAARPPGRRPGVFRNRWVCAALAVAFLAHLLPSLDKTPDLSDGGESRLAEVNNHYLFTLGHADRMAAGDVLFRDVTPKYGVLFPTLLAGWERHVGPLTLGAVMHALMGSELVYLAVAAWLFSAWARWRWLWAAAAVWIMLPFYYPHSTFHLHPNHGPCRMFGIPLAAAVMVGLGRASAGRAGWACGVAAGVGLLVNAESGVAACAGLAAYLGLRHGLTAGRPDWRKLAALAARGAGGAGLAVLGFLALHAALLGRLPGTDHISDLWRYARLGAGGFGSYPYASGLWPVVMFLHVGAAVVYTAFGGVYGQRQAARVGVGAVTLVWFAYFFNRPEPEYIASYLFLYGFFLIDALRTVALAVRRPKALDGAATAAGGAALAFALPWALGVVHWDAAARQLRMAVNPTFVPLVGPGERTRAEDAVLSSGVYVRSDCARALEARAAYLRHTAAGGRLIYFTTDSYLMPRLSGVFPKQEFIDPVEALDEASYERLCRFVLDSDEPAIYFDARPEVERIWYGRVFVLLRQSLAERYRLDRVESGWEVWVRK